MDVLSRRLTVDEVREIVEGQGRAIRQYHLYSGTGVKIYKDEQIFIEGYDNLNLPIKTWYTERVCGYDRIVILHLIMEE
jgi:hypothetical protein